MAEDPSDLVSIAFWRVVNGTSNVSAFRRVSELAQPEVLAVLREDANALVKDLRKDDGVGDLFSDLNPAMQARGGTQAFEHGLVEYHLGSFRIAVDAASLVFLHSLFDGVALLLLRAVRAADPDALAFLGKEKQFSLREIEAEGVLRLKQKAVNQILRSMEREGLVTKLDLLLKICKPRGGDWFGEGKERYSRERLKKIDDFRHDLIHGSGPPDKSGLPFLLRRWSNPGEDIEYMRRAMFAFVRLVQNSYNLTQGLHRVFF